MFGGMVSESLSILTGIQMHVSAETRLMGMSDDLNMHTGSDALGSLSGLSVHMTSKSCMLRSRSMLEMLSMSCLVAPRDVERCMLLT